MADEGTSDTFEKMLGGRLITFRRLGKAQLLMLTRYVAVAQEELNKAIEAEDGAAVDALLNKMNNATWSAVESLFINKDDIEHVQMGIISGTISDTDVLGVLSGKDDTPAPADDEDPPAPKKRAKKAAPAVAKANPRRAKR